MITSIIFRTFYESKSAIHCLHFFRAVETGRMYACDKFEKKLIELSYLKIHNKTHLFAKLYSVIGRARQSKIYEVMDEVEKLILKYCLRSRVSKPNKEKGKDYPTLIADLIKDDSSENETA